MIIYQFLMNYHKKKKKIVVKKKDWKNKNIQIEYDKILWIFLIILKVIFEKFQQYFQYMFFLLQAIEFFLIKIIHWQIHKYGIDGTFSVKSIFSYQSF